MGCLFPFPSPFTSSFPPPRTRSPSRRNTESSSRPVNSPARRVVKVIKQSLVQCTSPICPHRPPPWEGRELQRSGGSGRGSSRRTDLSGPRHRTGSEQAALFQSESPASGSPQQTRMAEIALEVTESVEMTQSFERFNPRSVCHPNRLGRPNSDFIRVTPT